MARIVVVSFRLGENDGVSVEARKWVDALRRLGHHVSTLAGSGQPDVVVASLAMHASAAPSHDEVAHHLRDADLTILENPSLPFNVAARNVLYDVLEGRRAIFHHHDLAWQRSRFRHDETPRTSRWWRHVTINDLSREQLRQRGVAASTIYNHFDCDPPAGDRDRTRRALGVGEQRLLLVPSRAIARKNIPGALELARQLGAVLWLLGPSEDDYEPTLRRLLSEHATRVIRGRAITGDLSVHDAYAASDLVVVSSTWEGFGNPTIESVTHRRPLAVYPYPVVREIRNFGFHFFDLANAAAIGAWLDDPDATMLEHNLALARTHFNLDQLAPRLATLLEECAITTPGP